MKSGCVSPTIVIFILCFLLTMFMGYKMYEKAQVRGWIPGARVVRYTVTQRYVERSKRLSRSDAYWVSWTNSVNVQTPGNHRINIPKEKYNNYQIGAPIEMVYVGSGDTPYLRYGDISTSNGNLIFDGALLFVVLIGTLATGIAFVLPEEGEKVRPIGS